MQELCRPITQEEPMRKRDSWLRENVIEELNGQPAVHAAAIGVAVENGVVTLSGRVGTYAEKVTATESAKHVSGVRALADEIEVRLPGLNVRSDSDIAGAARSAMDWNVLIPRDQVQVTVEDGWVTLTGDVGRYFERKAAEDTVRPLMGVRGVSNNIVVKPPAATASDVRDRIISALSRNALVEASRINVTANGGRVTLGGTVNSWAERDAVVGATLGTEGVSEVENRLEFAPVD
jgi:osmotically-inducible protein OsmY